MKIKNLVLFVSLSLIICSLLFDSPIGKGGIHRNGEFAIYFVTVSISILYFFTINGLMLAENLFYSLVLSFIALIISLGISESLLERIYGYDYEIYLSNYVANLIFYFLTNIMLIGCVYTIRRLKAYYQ
jgi:hypothetical protein